MRDKYILKTTDNENVETKTYKSLKQIAQDLDIEYFKIREIFDINQKPRKFYHAVTQNLLNKYSIILI